MKVWIIQTGEPLHIDKDGSRPMRGMNLANKLIDHGHDVTLWTARFNHRLKCQREILDDNISINERLEIKLISSPGYKSNVSFKRIYDHVILGLNTKKILQKTIDLPDVAFLGYPPIEINYFMANYLFKNKVPFLVDIKDQWPDFFLGALPKILMPIGRIILYPYKLIAKSIMSKANGLTSMSESFLQWSLQYIEKSKGIYDFVVPLTTPKNASINLNHDTNFWKKYNVLNKEKSNFLFVGSHYPSLDFDTIINAAKILKEKKIKCNIIICGDGELTNEIKQKSEGLNNIILPGWVDRKSIEAIASYSIAAICPFKNVNNYKLNIPNKIIDALSLSLPILSPVIGEISDLIEDKNIGLVYREMSPESLSSQIERMIDDKILHSQMVENTAKTYDELFDFNNVYNNLVEQLEKLSNKNL